MFRKLALMLVVTGFLCTGAPAFAMTKADLVNPTQTQTSTLTVTILKIDAAAGKVTFRDQNGKLWDFVVPAQSGIELSKFKVGEKVTATVDNANTSSSAVLRCLGLCRR